MSPERLAQLRAHFKNPPSSSCNAEWALELCDEVARLTLAQALEVTLLTGGAVARIDDALPAPDKPAVTLVSTSTPEPAPIVIDDRPKKKAKK